MILIDTHVHIYSCFNLADFFNSVSLNFQKAASDIGGTEDYTAILILTDWAGKSWFEKLSDFEKHFKNGIGDWKCIPTEESSSLYFQNNARHGFHLIAGRKIITSENLEVLALATDNPDFPDNLPLIETVQYIQSRNSIAVVPWAVGKWLGKRGKVLDELIDKLDAESYFLCDNRNRPFFWPKPKHFKIFEGKGGKLLAGSDPLHFSSESVRAGSFGCWTEGKIDSDHPTSSLKTILNDPATDIKLYGKLENLYGFFKNQLTIQIFKKKWKKEFYKS